MSIIGVATEWSDLIASMLPEVLSLVLECWEKMSSPEPDETEDNITIALCRVLKQNRTARGLMFQISTQVVELDPTPGENLGRLDIAFIPLVPREDIYFCIECKRLNVFKNGHLRTYASEYVRLGMLRFVTGQYSRMVRHGGMIGYVLDGNVSSALANVEANIRRHHKKLCTTSPYTLFLQSSVLIGDLRVQETHHQRAHETSIFRIHHMFVS
ncbi:MAG: hypothetical protein ACYC7E_00400 [Armatimonadota bacterium]